MLIVEGIIGLLGALIAWRLLVTYERDGWR